MKSSALFPFVVLMMAACSVQAAEKRKLTDPPVSFFQGTCESDPDGKKFAAKVCYTSYYPGRAITRSRYRPPTCEGTVSDQQRDMLARAYSRAPDYMKGKLCRLTQMFVTDFSMEGPMGWGFWEGPDRPPGKGVYLAVSKSELEMKQSVAEGENATVAMLLGLQPGGEGMGAGLVGLRSAAPADPELTVLAGIAHELGHALVADTNADGVRRAHPRRKVSGPPQSACFEDAFINASWDSGRFEKSMRRWVDFGRQYNNRQKNPDIRVSLRRLRTLAKAGNFNAVNDAIRKVYRSREFVIFSGSTNPWEDMVTTFTYKVLADTMPSLSIELQLDGQDINVLGLLKSEVVAKKVDCLSALGFLTGQP
jgi:hypothetical protein